MEFRVWDRVNKVLSKSNDKAFFLRSDGMVIDSNQWSDRGYVVQLSSGMKDKNGVTIYQGDKIKIADKEYVVGYGPYHDIDSVTPSIGWYCEAEGYKWSLPEGAEIVGTINI